MSLVSLLEKGSPPCNCIHHPSNGNAMSLHYKVKPGITLTFLSGTAKECGYALVLVHGIVKARK